MKNCTHNRWEKVLFRGIRLYHYCMELYRQYRTKLITIIVLCIAIVIGLIILNFKGCEKKAKPEPTPTPEVIVTPEPTPTPVPTPEPTPEAVVDLEGDDSINRYVSKTHLLPETYAPSDLRVVNVHAAAPQKLREEAAGKLEELFQAAIDDHIYLKLVSGYRSYREQSDLYSYYRQIRGQSYIDSVDDFPGGSEHQLGLAADLGCWNGSCELAYCFTSYPNYQWLLDNSWKYGWIERYPQGKQSVTGIRYSPWHYRYVGLEEAQKIYESGLTVEEYYNIQ